MTLTKSAAKFQNTNSSSFNFSETFDLYAKAESVIKKIELSKFQNLYIPAVNELRYAGNHLLRCLTHNDIHAAEEELARANRHCKRAIYDAADAYCLFFLDEINTFKLDYKDVIISEIIPEYTNYLAKAREVKEFISSTKGVEENEGDSHKIYNYDKAIEYAEQLKEIFDILEANRDELNKKIRQDNKDTRRFIITTIISIAVTGATIAACIFSWTELQEKKHNRMLDKIKNSNIIQH